MANDITDRIKEIINYKQLNVSSFESKIGASNGQIAKAIARKSALKSDLLDSILEFCPEINANWLVTGKGEMFAKNQKTTINSDDNSSESIVGTLLQRNEDLARENGRLQAENNELKKELARAETKMAASAKNAAG